MSTLPEDAIPKEINWREPRKETDWRNYVPEQVREIWQTFNADQRLQLFLWADRLYEEDEYADRTS